MQVLCVGDSLGMPRVNVPYESTWFYRLSHSYPGIDFIPKFKRRLTSDEILTPDYSSLYTPDIVILQIGICDCAPRLYKRDSLICIILERVFGKYFFKIIKRVRKRHPKYADVSVDDFRTNLQCYYDSIRGIPSFKQLIIILIGASNNKELLIQSPLWHDSIDKYNQILCSFDRFNDVTVINPLEGLSEDCFVEDGYHTNSKGNEVVFYELKRILNEYVKL